MPDIPPPPDYQAGESLTQAFTIEEDGAAKDIGGATVSWYLLPGPGADTADAQLDDGDSDVTAAIQTAKAGRVDVTLDQGATDSLGGDRYWQRLVVDDTGSGKQIWGGPFPIELP